MNSCIQHRTCGDVNRGVRLGQLQHTALDFHPAVYNNCVIVGGRNFGFRCICQNRKNRVIFAVQTNDEIIGTIQIHRNHAVVKTVAEVLPRRHDCIIGKITVHANIYTHAIPRKSKGRKAAEFIRPFAVNRVAACAAVLGVIINRKGRRLRSLGHADAIEIIPLNTGVKFRINDELVFHNGFSNKG